MSDLTAREREIVDVLRGRPSMTAAEIRRELRKHIEHRTETAVRARLRSLHRKGKVAPVGRDYDENAPTWRLLP